MNIGIVGSERAKFTPETEQKARDLIRGLIRQYPSVNVISGGCHLGGIDIWAIEESRKLGRPYTEFLPKVKAWEGYRARNIQIAQYSDIVYCITVKNLPEGFKQRGFERYCYHCNTKEHIKSGGCWTVKYACEKLNKIGHILVVE